MATPPPPTIKHVQINLYEDDNGEVKMNIQKNNSNVSVFPEDLTPISSSNFGDVEQMLKDKLGDFKAKDFSNNDSTPVKSMFSGMFSSKPTNTTRNMLSSVSSNVKGIVASSVNVPLNATKRTVANVKDMLNPAGKKKNSFEDILDNITKISNDNTHFDNSFNDAVSEYLKQLNTIKSSNDTKFTSLTIQWYNNGYEGSYMPTNLLNKEEWRGKEMYKIYNSIHVEYTLRKNLLKTLDELKKQIKDASGAAAAAASDAATKAAAKAAADIALNKANDAKAAAADAAKKAAAAKEAAAAKDKANKDHVDANATKDKADKDLDLANAATATTAAAATATTAADAAATTAAKKAATDAAEEATRNLATATTAADAAAKEAADAADKEAAAATAANDAAAAATTAAAAAADATTAAAAAAAPLLINQINTFQSTDYKSLRSLQLYTIYKNLQELIAQKKNNLTLFDDNTTTYYITKPDPTTILFQKDTSSAKYEIVSEKEMMTILNYNKPFTFINITAPTPDWRTYNIREIYMDIGKDIIIDPSNIKGNMRLNDGQILSATKSLVNVLNPKTKEYPLFGGRTKKYKKLHKRRIRKTYKR